MAGSSPLVSGRKIAWKFWFVVRPCAILFLLRHFDATEQDAGIRLQRVVRKQEIARSSLRAIPNAARRARMQTPCRTAVGLTRPSTLHLRRRSKAWMRGVKPAHDAERIAPARPELVNGARPRPAID